jgi:GAF domain-containing protein
MRPILRRSSRIQRWFIGSDIAVISLVYYLTNNLQSDVFLFYYLPILTAAEYLGLKGVLVVFGFVSLAFAGIIGLLIPTDPTLDRSAVSLRLLAGFVPREVFFFTVAVIMALLFRRERAQTQRERTQREEVSRREVEVEALLDFNDKVDQLFDIQEVLQLTIDKAVEMSGAAGGRVSLLDFETGKIGLQAHAPEDYFDRLGSSPEADRIAQQVVQQKRHYHARQWDPLLGSIGAETPGPLCVPIVAHDAVLGALFVSSKPDAPFGEGAEGFLKALAAQAAGAIGKARLLSAFADIGGTTARALELDRELDPILEELTRSLGLEFAAVSLVDKYRGTIEMVRAKNVPPGWMKRSRCALKSPDIDADIVRTGKTEVIEGWDERFDKEIYEKFEHAKLARVFAPIVAGGVRIGLIEAGCRKERRAEVLSQENVRRVTQLGEEKGPAVARILPYALLELIADRAIDIIGADSASVHVFRERELLLAAGAGRATQDFMARFRPTPRGIGEQAMQTGKPRMIDRPEELAKRNRPLYDEGVTAIAAFPLAIGPQVKGVLYVHFWHQEHRFSEAELKLGMVFAAQMEIAIQNNLLLGGIAKVAETAWTISGLQNVIQSLVSGGSLKEVLENLAQHVVSMLDAENVVLYQYYRGRNHFEVPPVMKGSFWQPESMQKHLCPDDVVWKILGARESLFISDVSHEPLLSGPRTDGVKTERFISREGICSSAVLVLRDREGEIVGLMFVNYRTQKTFSTEDQKAMNALASSAAIAIKSARLYEQVSRDLTRSDKELEALQAVQQAIVARAPKLEKVLDLILEKALEIIQAPVGHIMWFNRSENLLELKAQRGRTQSQQPTRRNLGEGIIGLAAQRKESVLVPDVTAEGWVGLCKPVMPETQAALAVPLLDQMNLLGVLSVEHRTPGTFSDHDRNFLEALAVQAAIMLHSEDLSQELQRQLKPLRSLSAIANRIQHVGYDLDTILRLVLTGVTAGEGLGFSRAMLFLTDDQATRLQGKLAIGPLTDSEARSTWERLEEDARKLRGRGEDVLGALLTEAEQFGTAIRNKEAIDSPLSLAVQRISIPLEGGAGALSLCVLENRPVCVEDDEPDPFRDLIGKAARPSSAALACVPLVGRGKTIGALVADSEFVPGQRQIDEADLRSLEAFAGVAAMSLQSHLGGEGWKDFTGRIAHIIGSRTSVVEGKVTRLRASLEEREIDRQAVNVLLGELERGISNAHKALDELRRFASPSSPKFESVDLTQLVNGVIKDLQPTLGFPIQWTCSDGPLAVEGDPLKLSDAFVELIRNSHDAMQEGRTASPRIAITGTLEPSSKASGTWVKLEFSDTGPGIPTNDKVRIFEPFFTTKAKGTSGLGLAIVKKAVEQHKGAIEEIGVPGEGARFVVRLPAIQ